MIRKKLFSVLFTVSLVYLASCSNNAEVPIPESQVMDENQTDLKLYDKEYIRTAPLDEQLDYREIHLTQLVNELISSGIDYGNSFSKQANKNGSYGVVFFRDLIYSAAMDSKEGDVGEDVQYSLSAFEGLAESTTAPYLEQIKDGDNADPIFLLSTFDTELNREIVVGYRVNSEQKLEQIEGEILETDIFGSETGRLAETNTVYKIGDTDACGNYYKAASCGNTGTVSETPSGTDVSGSTGTNPVSLRIENMKIKDKKESWLEKADVYIAGRFMSPSPNYFEEAVDVWYPNNLYPENRYRIPELFLSKYSSKDVKNGTFKTIEKHLMYDQGRAESSTFLSYIIYEWDGWPAQVKRVKFDRPGGTSAVFSYQSYNNYYIADQVRAERNFAPEPEYHVLRGFGNKMTNSTIEFNFTPSF